MHRPPAPLASVKPCVKHVLLRRKRHTPRGRPSCERARALTHSARPITMCCAYGRRVTHPDGDTISAGQRLSAGWLFASQAVQHFQEGGALAAAAIRLYKMRAFVAGSQRGGDNPWSIPAGLTSAIVVDCSRCNKQGSMAASNGARCVAPTDRITPPASTNMDGRSATDSWPLTFGHACTVHSSLPEIGGSIVISARTPHPRPNRRFSFSPPLSCILEPHSPRHLSRNAYRALPRSPHSCPHPPLCIGQATATVCRALRPGCSPPTRFRLRHASPFSSCRGGCSTAPKVTRLVTVPSIGPCRTREAASTCTL